MNLVSRLCGKINPISVKDYREYDGLKALEVCLFNREPNELVDIIKQSNLKGRGGAAFPTGLKWEFVASENNDTKYVVCNADEGEPGTFKDKVLLEGCPLQIIEGMIIAGYAVGANNGYIYIRGEYPRAKKLLIDAISNLEKEGYLGQNILGQEFSFNIEVRSGSGAYICGEETALIKSIEGDAGRARHKPPYPPNEGLWGKPTLVNNVETLANIPLIINMGPEEYKRYGTSSSNGTKLISVSGCVVNKGVFEVEFGITLREILFDICGGLKDGKQLKFIQLGGASGACLPEELLDTKLDFDELRKLDISLGSGAILVVDDTVDLLGFVKTTMEFFKHESCGKCVPCREGNKHIVKILDRIIQGNGTERDLDLLKNISMVMRDCSCCGLGQAAPTALITTMRFFEDEYNDLIHHHYKKDIDKLNREVIVNG